MIIIANTKQTKVLVVKMLSPKSIQLSIAKVIIPILEPMNLADHTDPNCSVACFQACQNSIPVGIPKTIAATINLSFHHSDKN
tara:strand:- start:504 stop:752 length:249 start_codon:yes stop_codon:yes gene_type:complete